MEDTVMEKDKERIIPPNNKETTLNFPFLKDCGPDPLNAAHYFNLTLGASMARTGDESHLKTLKQMFPSWFDPDYFSKQRLLTSTSITNTNLSSYGDPDNLFSASSTNLIPGYSTNAPDSSMSTISTPISPTTSSSVHLSQLPTPRLSYHSISSPLRKCSPLPINTHIGTESGIQENSEFSTGSDAHNSKNLIKGNERRRVGYYEKSMNLFPIDKQNERENSLQQPDYHQQSTYSMQTHSSHSAASLAWSSDDNVHRGEHRADEVPTDTCTNKSQGANPKVLWRKLTSAGAFLRSSQNKSAGELSRAEKRSSPKRSKSVVNFTTPFIIPPTPTSNQSASSIAREWRRSSTVSQSGRRLSTVDRLLSDVTYIPERAGMSGLIQRRRRSSRRTSDVSVFMDMNKSPRIRGIALQRFRRIARIVQIITKVCWALKSYVREIDSTHWSFVEMYLHLQNDISPDLFFDRQQFSKIEPPKGGRRLERLLSVPSHLRSPDHIQQILAFVRTHQTFQHFPADAQVKFCQVMQYQSYDPRMVILKQGHPPSSFYLILSGTLMVNIRQTNPMTGSTFVQTVGMMHHGECFGEIALLEERLRTASVVCKSRTELLVIYKEDFDRIVREPLLDQRDINVNLCTSHHLFEEFPRDVFYSNPGHFFYQFFPKDTIIAKNSNECPFLILVKSGECQLLGSYKRYEAANAKRALISRDVETLFPLYTDIKKAESNKIQDTSSKTESVSAITSALESTLLNEHRVGKLIAKPIPKPGLQETPAAAQVRSFGKHRSKTLSNLFDQLEKDKRTGQGAPDDASSPDLDNYWCSKICGRRPRSSASRLSQTKAKESNFWRVLNEDAREFVQVATLKQGYVFGLETLAGLDAPPLTVVSGGVECILVSKQLFLTHANIKSLRVAGDLVTTFPPSSSLRQQIDTNRKWRHYKRKLVATVMSNG